MGAAFIGIGARSAPTAELEIGAANTTEIAVANINPFPILMQFPCERLAGSKLCDFLSSLFGLGDSLFNLH